MFSFRRAFGAGMLLLGILGTPACKKAGSGPAEAPSNDAEQRSMERQAQEEAIKRLKDPDPRVRQLAAETLGKQSAESAVPSLAQSLKDVDKGVREAAAKALEQIGTKAILELVGMLGDEDESVRLGSIKVLWRLPADASEFRSKEALAALTAALKDEVVDVRIHSAMILGNIGPDAKPALPALIEASKDTGNLGPQLGATPGSVTEAAIQAALKLDPECGEVLAAAALPHLIAALQSENGALVQAAGFALARLGTHAKPALPAIKTAQKRKRGAFSDIALAAALKAAGGEAFLIELVLDEQAPLDHRVNAISNLGRDGSDRSIATLMKALDDREPSIRTAAVDGLRSCGPKAKPAIPKLIEALADDKIRDYSVTFALSAIGPDAITAMIEVLKDADARLVIRFRVAETIGRMGLKAKPALSALEANLKDENPAIALISAEAFVLVGGDVEKALPVARAGLKKDPAYMKILAAGGLEKMGVRAAVAVPDLMPLLKHDESEVRIASAHALGRMGSLAKPAVPAMAAMLSSKDGRERFQAAKALAAMGADAKEALPALIAELDNLPGISPHPVLVAIGNLGPDAKAAVPALVSLLKKDGLSASDAVEVLGKIGPNAKPAVPELAKRLENPGDLYRQMTARCLALIGPEAIEAVPALKLRLTDESKKVRVWAACALARITSNGAHVRFLMDMWEASPISEVNDELARVFEVLGENARPARDLLLASVTDDKNSTFAVRIHAAGALGQMSADSELVLPILMKLLDSDDVSDNRIAIEGLQWMGPKAVSALPRLRKLLDHEDNRVADGAREALKRIEAK
jgi:HEAT repeat protein